MNFIGEKGEALTTAEAGQDTAPLTPGPELVGERRSEAVATAGSLPPLIYSTPSCTVPPAQKGVDTPITWAEIVQGLDSPQNSLTLHNLSGTPAEDPKPPLHSSTEPTDSPTEIGGSLHSGLCSRLNPLLASKDTIPKSQKKMSPPKPKPASVASGSQTSQSPSSISQAYRAACSSPKETGWDPCTDSDFAGSGPMAPTPSPMDLNQLLSQIPTKEDFRVLISEVKDTCRAEIASIRQDLQHVSNRVEGLEEAHDSTRAYIAQLHRTIVAQSEFMGDMHNHVEDLDNRGRRNNIRVRGLPEATQAEDLPATLEAIFNKILGEPSSHKIEFVRAHRALRPRSSNGPPRDVICCILDFPLKEKIMTRARSLRNLDYDGASIQLYQDLSWITLRKRRMLQPLLASLRSAQIPYRWTFPFALQARKDGRSAILRSFADLAEFCDILDIPIPQMANWGLSPPPPPLPAVWQSVRAKRPRSNQERSSPKHRGSPNDPP